MGVPNRPPTLPLTPILTHPEHHWVGNVGLESHNGIIIKHLAAVFGTGAERALPEKLGDR